MWAAEFKYSCNFTRHLSFPSPEVLVRKWNFIKVSEVLLAVVEIRKHKANIRGKKTTLKFFCSDLLRCTVCASQRCIPLEICVKCLHCTVLHTAYSSCVEGI